MSRRIALALVAAVPLAGCGINSVPTAEEDSGAKEPIGSAGSGKGRKEEVMAHSSSRGSSPPASRRRGR